MTVDFTLKQLEIFRSVVVAGSITKASQRIGLAQPSISQQLAKLEELLKVQLILRNRTGLISLTPAGEFWFKSSDDILGRIENVVDEHEQRFKHSNVTLRLGATPALRGRITAAAARIAQKEKGFVKFELIYDLSSDRVVEQLRMHRLNFAVASEQSLAGDQSSFAVEKLFDEKIAWAVPSSIGIEEIKKALAPDTSASDIEPILRRYVEIDQAVPTRAASDDWYRHYLPTAMPIFSAPTFAASVDFVVEGLATCHIPLSLLPNLTEAQRQSVNLFVIDGMGRRIMLAMPRHLQTLGAYARIFQGLVSFCRNEYALEMMPEGVGKFSDLLEQADMPGQNLGATSANILHR